MAEKWEKVGKVAVDTGRVAIIDPAFFDDLAAFEGEISEVLKSGPPWTEEQRAFPLTGDVGPGFIVSSGIGDGLYDIEVRYEDVDDWGPVVAEMRVLFLTPKKRAIVYDPELAAQQRLEEIGWKATEADVELIDGDQSLGAAPGWRVFNGERELFVEEGELADLLVDIELENRVSESSAE